MHSMPNPLMDILRRNNIANEFIAYVEKWIGTPYTWAGDDFSSLDCSGLMMEGFKGIGEFDDAEDYSANGLYKLFKARKCVEPKKPYMGCLVFWLNKKGKAVHVAVMKDNHLLIHAAGGGQLTETIEDARRNNAYVKQRSLEKVAACRKRRYQQIYKIVDPFLIKKK